MLKFLMVLMSLLFAGSVSFAANNNQNNRHVCVVSLGSITATADTYGCYVPQKSKVVAVKVVNGATISASDSNYALIEVLAGSTSVAKHQTTITGKIGEDLNANVPAAAVLTTANVVNSGVNVPAGSWLKVAYTETGTYAMTTAFVVVEYYAM